MGDAHWYGGGEVFDQSWPIDGDTTLMGDGGRPDVPYVTGDFFHMDYAGVMEPYWINTDGFGLYALRENALFVSWNSSGDHQLCLKSRYETPYPIPDASSNQPLTLKYRICSTSDVKAMHMLALSQGFWKKPRQVADQRVMEHPIWSTWARYKTLVNQARVISFADQILRYGFNNSQLEVDDRWESCYGEHRFDATKFADPADMVSQLHNKVNKTMAPSTPHGIYPLAFPKISQSIHRVVITDCVFCPHERDCVSFVRWDVHRDRNGGGNFSFSKLQPAPSFFKVNYCISFFQKSSATEE